MKNITLLASKLLWRDWRAGELRILLFALLLAVATVCSISFYTNRVTLALQQQAASLLGADLIAKDSNPISTAWQALAKHLNLQTSVTITYPTVVTAHDQLQLVNLKAVPANYPLRGTVTISKEVNGSAQIMLTMPEPGTVWVDARLLDLLSLKIGDQIAIGAANFKVTAILETQPQSSLFVIAPNVLINQQDIAKTQTLVPGSRVEYNLLVAGNATDVIQFKKTLQLTLKPNQKIIDLDSNQPAMRDTLTRAMNYLTLASLICTLLAGIAIACAAYRYAERHLNNMALLRCLGLTHKQLLQVILLQLISIGFIGCLLGCALGYVGQNIFVVIFAPWLNLTLPAPGFNPVTLGFLTGFLLLLGFAVPRFLVLAHALPLQVFRKDLPAYSPNGIIVYGLALFALTGLLFFYTQNNLLTFLLVVSLSLAALILYFSARLLIKISGIFNKQISITWRYGLTNLVRRAQTSAIQLIAFGLIIMTVLLLWMVRYDLVNTWRAQIVKDAPNYFAINIQPSELNQVTAFLNQHHVQYSRIYPIVRGRLIALNNISIKQAVPAAAKNNNALNRELNLTWSAQLPISNRIMNGRWWQPQDKAVVSIEQDLAKNLGIKLGDTLSFQIADQTLQAKVISMRSLEWSSMQPNFFMIFPSGILNDFPVTYLTSFHVAPNNKAVLATLVKQFPSITIIDIAEIITQVQNMIARLSLAISYLIILTLIAGVIVLYAAIQATLPERIYESALMRLLGANSAQLRSSLITEFIALGLLASLLGTLGAVIISAVLTTQVFALGFHINYLLCFASILFGTLAILLAGLSSTRKVMQQAPLFIIRKSSN